MFVLKTIIDNKEKISRIVFTALVSIAGALILLLLVGTIFGIARPRHAEPILTLGNPQQVVIQSDDIRIFSALGRQRIPLGESSVLIISITFPYAADDIAFTEELVVKIDDMRGIASDYFSSLSAENMFQIDEEAAKREILRRFNANLRLGRIAVLYFSDMMVIDTPQSNL